MSKIIRLIVTSDTHAHWLNRPDTPDESLFNTAGLVQTLQQKESDVTLTIDIGDFIQGSSFATYLNQEYRSGKVLARAMNAMGYDYQLIGNHEFNFGQEYRDQILRDLKAQILLSNIVKEGTNNPFIGKPYDIIEKEGIRIGIIGVTTSYIPHWELPKHYMGLEFIDAFASAKHYAKIVRPQVDIMILAYHGGFERDIETGEPLEELTLENQAYQMLEGIEGIDVLLTGHQHRKLNQLSDKTWIVQPGYGGEYVAEVEVTFDGTEVTQMKGELHKTIKNIKNQMLYPLLEPELSEGDEWLSHVIGEAPLKQTTNNEFTARMYGHPYIEMINQIQLEETGADFSAVALINDAFTHFHGPITHEILLKSYPYYNLIAKVNITGEELYQIMAFNFEYFALNAEGLLTVDADYLYPKERHYNFDLYSGIQTTVDMNQSADKRIVKLIDERTGEPVDRAVSYSLAISQYRAVGGGNFVWFNQSKIESLSTIDIATLIEESLKTYDDQKWDYINNNYRHIIWSPPVVSKYKKNS